LQNESALASTAAQEQTFQNCSSGPILLKKVGDRIELILPDDL
jgi:hypothetical protein